MGSKQSSSNRKSLVTGQDQDDKKTRHQSMPAIITEEEIEYFKSQTGLTKSEIKEVFKQFNKECTNGELNEQEFNELYKRLNKNGLKNFEESTKFAFNAFDQNNNRTITFKEFILTYALQQPDNLERKIINTFDAIDIDQDGYLDIDELYVVIARIFQLLDGEKKLQKNSLKFTQEFVHRLDKNKDGKISKNEYLKGLLNNPDLRILLHPIE